MLNVSDQIAKYLKKTGITQIFTVTGGGAMFLNKAFHDNFKDISYLHHEQACSMAAEGYARIKNKPAIVNVTSGPGGINALNGVFGAFTDSIPMIVISGQVKNETLVRSYKDSNLRQLGDQEANIEEIVRPITKYVVSIKKAKDLETELPKAIYLASSGRPGPIWIDIPSDIQMDNSTLNFRSFNENTKITNGKNAIKLQRFKKLIEASKRPLILAGTGIRISSTERDLKRFSKNLNIPIATAWTHDLIESDSKLFAGRPGTIGTRPGNFCLQNCDLLIVLGSRLNIRQTGFNFEGFAKKAKVVHVDIDKSELNKFYLKSKLKINSDLRTFFKEINSLDIDIQKRKFDNWVNWCEKINKKYSINQEIFCEDKPNFLNPYKAIIQISDLLEEDDIIVCGNASACIIPFQTIQIKKGQRLFSNSGSASMGFDLPAAIGAGLAVKRKKNSRIICFAGDGSLQMNIQELQTLKSLDLNLKIFLINNNGYLSIKSTHNNFFGETFGCHPESGIDFPSFHNIASAYGIKSLVVDNMQSLKALKNKINKPGPLLIELMVDTNQEFCPKLKSRLDANGKFITPELDDMFPFVDKEELDNIRQSAEAL